MILLLDIGNTRMKWALYDDRSDGARGTAGALSFFGAEPHRGDPAGTFDSLEWPVVTAVWAAMVLGTEHELHLTDRINQRLGHTPNYARVAAERNGLRLAYADPSRLGIDRWLAMLAAWRQQRGAFSVVSAGTALTFDRVDGNGRHLGGLIAPGYSSALHALGHVTRAQADSTPEAVREGLGKDTQSCIRQGALFAARGVMEQALQTPGGSPDEARLLTGGDAQILHPLLSSQWTLRPHLVLEGLLTLI